MSVRPSVRLSIHHKPALYHFKIKVSSAIEIQNGSYAYRVHSGLELHLAKRTVAKKWRFDFGLIFKITAFRHTGFLIIKF